MEDPYLQLRIELPALCNEPYVMDGFLRYAHALSKAEERLVTTKFVIGWYKSLFVLYHIIKQLSFR